MKSFENLFFIANNNEVGWVTFSTLFQGKYQDGAKDELWATNHSGPRPMEEQLPYLKTVLQAQPLYHKPCGSETGLCLEQ